MTTDQLADEYLESWFQKELEKTKREEFHQKIDEILAKEQNIGTPAVVEALQALLKQMRDNSPKQ